MVEVYDKNGVRRDWEWLLAEHGSIVHLKAGPAPKFALARIDETEGPAVLTVRVVDEDGNPIVDQQVINHWPDPTLPDLTGGGLRTLWYPRGIVQRTDRDGFTGFGLGGGSFVKDPQAGGPHTVWVGSPTYPSDGISGIGMKMGTNHRGPLHLTFVLVRESQEQPPSGEEPPAPADLDAVVNELQAIRAAVERLAAHLGAG